MIYINPLDNYLFMGQKPVYKFKTDDRVVFELKNGTHRGTVKGLAMDLNPENQIWIIELDEPIQDTNTDMIYKAIILPGGLMNHE